MTQALIGIVCFVASVTICYKLCTQKRDSSRREPKLEDITVQKFLARANKRSLNIDDLPTPVFSIFVVRGVLKGKEAQGIVFDVGIPVVYNEVGCTETEFTETTILHSFPIHMSPKEFDKRSNDAIQLWNTLQYDSNSCHGRHFIYDILQRYCADNISELRPSEPLLKCFIPGTRKEYFDIGIQISEFYFSNKETGLFHTDVIFHDGELLTFGESTGLPRIAKHDLPVKYLTTYWYKVYDARNQLDEIKTEIIAEWNTLKYHPYNCNCNHFGRDVLSRFGLSPPPKKHFTGIQDPIKKKVPAVDLNPDPSGVSTIASYDPALFPQHQEEEEDEQTAEKVVCGSGHGAQNETSDPDEIKMIQYNVEADGSFTAFAL